MNFVRSRVALVSLVVAWPLSQMVGCAPTTRDYGPAGAGEGGDVGTGGTDGSVGGASGGNGGTKGGTGGTKGGGSGSSSGGTDGGTDASGGTNANGGSSGASGGRGGRGGTSGGKGGSGGASGASGGTDGGTDNGGTDSGTGGSEAGSGGTGDTGGTAGTGGTVDPGCVATGAEICNDGIDNDCDGSTDCLVLTSEFPVRNGAASGSDVKYQFEAPATGANFQCRVTHSDTPSGGFKACAGGVVDAAVSPFDGTMAADPLNDGFWTTEVRLRFAGGATSDTFRRTVYIHSSLVGQTRCEELESTEAWVAAASSHLADEGALVAVTVRSPFVQIAFDPPVVERHHVGADDGTVKWRSLRRQFQFSDDKHYLVMTRTYTSRFATGMGCYAARKRIHHLRGTSLASGPMTYQDCMAVVFNKAGAGYCLDHVGGAIIGVNFERAVGTYWTSTGPGAGSFGDSTTSLEAVYAVTPAADHLLWRKLTSKTRPDAGAFTANFSSKCDLDGCAAGDTLFLPDKQYFGYWE